MHEAELCIKGAFQPQIFGRDNWGLRRLENLIALRDGHCAGFGPSIRRPTPDQIQ